MTEATSSAGETATTSPPAPAAVAATSIVAGQSGDGRITDYTQGANFEWVVSALAERRDEILDRWLESAAQQPFHAGRKERAVTDHIPALFDALVGLLRTTAPRWIDAYGPLEDIGVLSAGQSHARVRAAQGLKAADVVVEFRLLRQEIWRALRAAIPNSAPTGDVVAAELLVNDALDGAITQALATLSAEVEQAREDFLATTVHDVRQPLTALYGEIQFLARSLLKPQPNFERLRDSAARMTVTARRMMSLLDSLADSSKLAVGSLDLRLSDVDLAEIVHTALLSCPPDDVARVALTVSSACELRGEWDPGRLEQVVSNLLGNAFKYSAPGTAVHINLTGDQATATLAVSDQGIGIPVGELGEIFKRYKRASNIDARLSTGSGLGLYLCQGVVEAHGGRIWAESAGVGAGTTITVLLPRKTSGLPSS